MADRASSYRSLRLDIPADPSGAIPITPMPGNFAGTPITAITVLRLPPEAFDTNGVCFVILYIGDGGGPIRMKENLSWSAQLDGAGRPIPETTGLFYSVNDDIAVGAPGNIVGIELYVELQRPLTS